MVEADAVIPLAVVQVSNWSELAAAVDDADPGVLVAVELMNDIPHEGHIAIEIVEGREIILTSSGGAQYTLVQGTAGERHFVITQGILTLQNVILSGDRTNVAGNHGGVALGTSNTPNVRRLYMGEGSVITNNRFDQGGGVMMWGGVNAHLNTTFTMDNGAILSDNEATGDGGGVSVTGGSAFSLNSGNIAGNIAANSGGGVHVVGSRFTMADGGIYGNSAHTGGGIFATQATTVAVMQGGRIEHNLASVFGGGVAVRGGCTFTMTGGTIYDNNANDGGGVEIMGVNSEFVMQGGLIDYNAATLFGGGVYISGVGRFTMGDGGTISRNTAGNSGGGVNVLGLNTLFTMNGGELYENTSHNTGGNFGGGGVNIQSGTFTMHNGTIRDNHSASNGGGVRRGLLAVAAYFNMHGGAISDNTATGSGGGLFAQGQAYSDPLPMDSYPRITIAPGAAFSGNRALSGAFRPPSNALDATEIRSTSATLFNHPLNNYDINYRQGPQVHTLTITYMATAYGTFDGLGASDVRTETIDVDTATFPVSPQLVPTVTAIPGHTFIGWIQYGDPIQTRLNDVQVRALSITDDTTFIAQYEGIIYHTVTFLWNYTPRLNPVYLYQTIEHGQPVASPADPVRLDYVFQGWFLDPAGTLPYHFNLPVVANLSLYADWTPGPPPPDMVHHNFLIGDENGMIRPRANITRADVASIFLRIISDEQRAEAWTRENPYPDVSIDQWFNNAISTTSNAGLFTGLPSGYFEPHQPMTRAEVVTVVARFTDMSYEGADLFSDIDGHWARNAINAVADAGWIHGPRGRSGPFLPDDPISRAETAAIINRMLNRLPEGPDDLLDGMRTWPDNANPSAWYYLYIQEASNSHTYMQKADGIHERWVQLVSDRPWALLQHPDSEPGDIFQTAP